uniref:Starch-binding domain-containing protein 1 n=1 Tax=Sus scrofa TaxID=9823 RepID=A0A8D0NTQ2_PIG
EVLPHPLCSGSTPAHPPQPRSSPTHIGVFRVEVLGSSGFYVAALLLNVCKEEAARCPELPQAGLGLAGSCSGKSRRRGRRGLARGSRAPWGPQPCGTHLDPDAQCSRPPATGGVGKGREHPQESNGCLVSETKGPGDLQEAARRQQGPSGEGGNCDSSRAHVPSGKLPDTGSLATSESSHAGSYSDVSSTESLGSPVGAWRFQKGQETPTKAAPCLAEKSPSGNLLLDRGKEVSLAQSDSQARADHEDWEMVARHSSWGDVGLGGSLEAPVLSSNQGKDYGRRTLVEARAQEVDVKRKKVAGVSWESRQVSIRFQVHYITGAGVQFIAVTGDHESLGRWKAYIPLQCSQDGLWSRSVPLPADTGVEWKFVVVENGEVTRWEECSNRFLETGHEDQVVHKWWGIH